MKKSQHTSQVEKAIKKIEYRYAIGQAILKACGSTSPHGLIAELAEQYDINRDSAQKFRAMASKEKEFDLTDRSMKSWVMAKPELIKEKDDLKLWSEIAVNFVETLPAKRMDGV